MLYTAEITKKLSEDYLAGVPVSDLAKELNTTERSIRSKLAYLGVYKKKVYTNKRGEAPVTKEQYVDRIAKILDVPVDILDSLEKTNKNVLILLEKALIGE